MDDDQRRRRDDIATAGGWILTAAVVAVLAMGATLAARNQEANRHAAPQPAPSASPAPAAGAPEAAGSRPRRPWGRPPCRRTRGGSTHRRARTWPA